MYDNRANTPQTELERRNEQLKRYLKKHDIDAALILQPIELFYFAGTLQKANLYIPADGDPIQMVNKST